MKGIYHIYSVVICLHENIWRVQASQAQLLFCAGSLQYTQRQPSCLRALYPPDKPLRPEISSVCFCREWHEEALAQSFQAAL